MVIVPYTIVDPGAVVVHFVTASIANAAMVGSWGFASLAALAILKLAAISFFLRLPAFRSISGPGEYGLQVLIVSKLTVATNHVSSSVPGTLPKPRRTTLSMVVKKIKEIKQRVIIGPQWNRRNPQILARARRIEPATISEGWALLGGGVRVCSWQAGNCNWGKPGQGQPGS